MLKKLALLYLVVLVENDDSFAPTGTSDFVWMSQQEVIRTGYENLFSRTGGTEELKTPGQPTREEFWNERNV